MKKKIIDGYQKYKDIVFFVLMLFVAITMFNSYLNPLVAQGTTNFSSMSLSGDLSVTGNTTLTGTLDSTGAITMDSWDLQGAADAGILDDDGDTTISAPTDDQIDFELGGVDHAVLDAVAGADGATTTNIYELAFTSPVDTTGSNTHNAFVCDLAIGNASGGTNVVQCVQIDAITGDAQVTENAVAIGTGWDTALLLASPSLMTYIASADSAATNHAFEAAFTTPVDTTGTNTHNVFACDIALGNATGGDNQVTCLQIDSITGDAQVVETAINIGSGWDYSIDTTVPAILSAQVMFEEFLGDTANPTWDYESGSGASDPALGTTQYGALRGTTAATDTDFATDHVGFDTAGLFWSADQGAMVFEARFLIDAITDVEICLGLTDTDTMEMPASIAGTTITTAADDALVFCFDTAADTDEWYAIGVAGTTDATGNALTGVAPSAGVYQIFRIEVDIAGADARFYIDGVLVGTLTANAITITDLLTPVVVVDNLGGAARVFDLDYIYLGSERN